MNQDNGGIIGKINTPTTLVASGVWTLQDQFEAQSSSTWPLAFPQTTIANSCRFDVNNSDFLSRTPSGAGNRQKFTFSGWIKRTIDVAAYGYSTLFSAGTDSDVQGYVQAVIWGDNQDWFELTVYDSSYLRFRTSQLFRDKSAWYHIVVAVDTTQSSNSDRVKIYVNGSQVTSFATYNTMPENFSTSVNNTVLQQVGVSRGSSAANGNYLNGYLAESILVDGQQLTPTNFGATNPVTNIWEPIPYTGTYGTNGYKLNYSDASNLGDDTSGNGNDFTVGNLTSVAQSTDTPSNNFAVLNALNQTPSNNFVLSNGSLTTVTSGDASAMYYGGSSTIGVSKGKWYCEFKGTSNGGNVLSGISSNPSEDARLNNYIGEGSYAYGYYAAGTSWNNNSSSSYGDTYTTNDIIGIAMDLDNSKLYFSKNGVFQNSGDPTSGSTGTGAISITANETYFFSFGDQSSSPKSTINVNFGSPMETISSGNADANGHGNFEYAVPSGYFALCTKNLSEFG